MVAMMTVVSSLFTLTTTAQTCQYYTTVGDSVQYKYEYTLDHKGRVAEKIRMRWDDSKAEWVPLTQYTVQYGKKNHLLIFSVWNNDTHSFVEKASEVFYADDYSALLYLPRMFAQR